jgi:hypothetical protein
MVIYVREHVIRSLSKMTTTRNTQISTMQENESAHHDRKLLKRLRYRIRRLVKRPQLGSTVSRNQAISASPTRQSILAPPSTPSPRFQQALIVAGKREYELRNEFCFPEIQNEDEVMIRTCAVGLNPIDWKSVDYNFCLPSFPWVSLPIQIYMIHH